MNFALITRNFVVKTRNFAFNMMNSADEAGKLLEALRVPVYKQLQAFKTAIVASCE